jgi:catechol 2,3-dioxygenase-like lactoylglutathione lyase family enzyme
VTRVNGIHHLAINTADIKSQIEFFTDVLGAELVGLFWMHGVEGAWHAFCRLDDHCSISFVELPANHDIESTIGITHAGTGAGPSAPGTTQHMAFNVDTLDQLLAMRDRIRSRGINVMGHIDHGMCQSIYFAGPEGLTLEVATSAAAIDAERWIDPEVVERAGISAEELDRYKHPEPFTPGDAAVPQPPIDPSRPHMSYAPDDYERMMSIPDDVLTAAASFAEPPVTAHAADGTAHS